MGELNIIRSMYENYYSWLLASEWFPALDDTAELLNSLSAIKDAIDNALFSEDAESAALLYGAVVEHFHETDWHWDDAPELFQDLYDAIDQYRIERPVMLSD